MTTPTNPPPKVPSVAHAAAILRYLSESPSPLGVNPIARALGLSPSSCFNILKTLVGEKFVEFDPTSKGYSIGSGAVRLAGRALDPTHAFEAARPDMMGLARTHAATCALWRVLPDDRLMIVGHVEGREHTGIHMSVGQRVPLLVGATGRCVVAAMKLDRAELERRFLSVVWENPPKFEDYLKDVELAGQHGWASDNGAYIRGVTSVAAALLDDRGAPRFALGIHMFGGDHPPRVLKTIGAETISVANQIATRLFGTR